jgi:hypothetical protein
MLIELVTEIGKKGKFSLYEVGCLVQLRKSVIKQIAYHKHIENDIGVVLKIKVGMSWDLVDYTDYTVYWSALDKEVAIKEKHLKRIG